MNDLQLETTLTANAGPLNAALQSGAAGVKQFTADATQATGAQARATAQQTAALQAQQAAMRQARASSNQLREAYRQLPAQITDVTTSLASGMPLWLVAIQQGGQIKDSFGGAGAAFRGVASLITPVRVGFAALTATVGALLLAYNRGAAEADAYNRAIILSGNAAGVTRTQLAGIAAGIDKVVGTQAQAADAVAQAVATGYVAAQNIERVALAAIRMQREAGVAVKDTVAEFAALGKDPVAASVKLNEQYNYLTVSIYNQIKALEKRGQVEQAADLAQATYAAAMVQRAAELERNLGSIERAWRNVKDFAAEAWDAMLGVGRRDTPAQELAKAQAQLAALENPNRRSQDPRRDEERKAAVRQRVADLQLQIYQEGEMAAAQGASAQATREAIKTDKEREKSAQASADAYERLRQSIAERMAVLQAELTGGRQLNEVQRLELDLRRDLAEAEGKLAPAQRARLRADADAVLAAAQRVQLQREISAGVKAELEVTRQAGEAALRQALSTEQGNEALRNEIEVMGLSEQAVLAVERARLSSTIAMKEERLERLLQLPVMTLEAQALKDEIELLKQRQGLLGLRQRRKEDLAFEDGLKRQAEMQQQADEARREGIALSISEGVASGTLSAKKLWDLFRQELVRSFARTVLMPGIQPAVNQADSWIGMAINGLQTYFNGGFGTGSGFGNQDYGQFFHGGGVVGVDRPAFQRALPASLWANAPRYHKGMLAPNEKAAVLQDGESVLTPGQMRAVAGAGGPQVVQNITYNVPPGQSPAAYAQALQANNERLKAEMAGEMSRPGRPLQRAAAAARY